MFPMCHAPQSFFLFLTHMPNAYTYTVISNTIKENPEVLEEYSSLVFGVNHKCYGFLESLEPQDVRGGLRFPVFRFISGL